LSNEEVKGHGEYKHKYIYMFFLFMAKLIIHLMNLQSNTTLMDYHKMWCACSGVARRWRTRTYVKVVPKS